VTWANSDEIVGSVQQYIKSKAPAMLTLGGYVGTQTGNNRYPGIQSYIPEEQLVLKKFDVKSVMSPTNTRNEVVQAVSSAGFFELNTYTEAKKALQRLQENDIELFTVSQNKEFLQKSGLVGS
jgi:hypothetical protein